MNQKYFIEKPLLFNLVDDLTETKDVSSAEPEKLAELIALLEKVTADGHTRPGYRKQ